MASEFRVFISSKMLELAPERQALNDLLPTLGSDLITLRAWVFEDDAPAADKPIREVYLDALKRSDLYLGLFWNGYGEWTVDEFQHATEWSIDRHIYVKSQDAEGRDPRLQAFLDEQSNVISGITPKWFTTPDDLREQVRKSIDVWLRDRLARRPGDLSATLAEFSDDIPDLPSRLFGRDETLAEVRARLDEGARVLLQGFGGMGKSALAATVAADWLDDDKGAALWLRVGSEDADTILEALARPFDAHQDIAKAAGREKTRVLQRVLTGSEVTLLVLDDVWEGAALNEVLRAVPRRLPVLVTARQRYALDYILEIRGLDAAQALRMLCYHAGRDYPDDDAALEICHQVGYHAFALEVAGKTLKVDQIRPRELLRRIETAPHTMAMPQDFAEEGRTSITELLTASLYALDDETRQVFLAFGRLFVPQVTPELLARGMSRAESEVGEALTTLQRRGLAERVRPSEDGLAAFRVHDLAYSYARTITAGQDRTAIVEACRAFADDHADDLKALDAEQGNLLGAAQAAHETGQREALVGIVQTLAGLYLSARGHTLAFLDRLDAAITAAAQLGPDYDETRDFLLGKRGNTYTDRGDLANALKCYQEALTLARAHDQPDRQALLLGVIGKVIGAQGGDPAAPFAEAYQIASARDNGFVLAFVLEQQGYYAQSRQDYAAAHRIYAEEVALAERIDDPETLFSSLLNLGSAEHDLHEFAAALAHHERALLIARDLDNRVLEAYALQSIGEDQHRLGDTVQARENLALALDIYRATGMSAQAATVEEYLKSVMSRES
jgi:tetratricopeptide (TPR) repeat protein